MSRYEWLEVGLKLLGVYFGVSGFVMLWTSLLALMIAPEGDARVHGMWAMLVPAAQLLVAFYLVCRTPTCLRWCGESEPAQSA